MSSTKTSKSTVERLQQALYAQVLKQREYEERLLNNFIGQQRMATENAMREASAPSGGGGSGKAGLLLGLGAAGLGGYYLGRKLNKGKKKT